MALSGWVLDKSAAVRENDPVVSRQLAELAGSLFVCQVGELEQLLARAKRALGSPTTRATVEEALRRAAEQAEDERAERAARQIEYLKSLATHVDLEVLASDEMWR